MQPRSLVWRGDELVDWVGGQCIYRLDGSIEDSRVRYAYRFDNAISSPSGRWALIFETLGTKALLLDQGKIVREINRSLYHANVYGYPAAFLILPDGREGLLHCPKDYCQLDIEDLATGEVLTKSQDRDPKDVFHGRLVISPDSSYFMSAGWIWHPADVVAIDKVRAFTEDPTLVDSLGWRHAYCDADFDLWATFLDESRYIVFALDPRIAYATGQSDTAFKAFTYANRSQATEA